MRRMVAPKSVAKSSVLNQEFYHGNRQHQKKQVRVSVVSIDPVKIMHPPSPKISSLSDAIERCQALGMRLSQQRRYILELLWDVQDHLSAREIYDELNQRGKKIGHTSVYQNLDALFEQGIIECVERSDGRLYGHLNSSHSHVTCLDTQKIIDIKIELPSAVIQEVEKCTGLKITDYRIDFFGTANNEQAER